MSKNFGTRYNYSQEFKREVCEYYSNHTGPETLAHFNLSCDKTLLSQWYKQLGFLPKSAGRNPNPNRVAKPKVTRNKLNFMVKSGGYIMNGKFYGKTEFAKMQRQMKVGDTFTKVTVTKHKVGIVECE